ncbi:uncharacterized protein LOC107027425 [Solanum pennellii]|uniref:Uncharacterized protein LOC107027425 n=1 Tax=Solanum pennellii TaxID=28526 RepID=A0ABM1HDX3_SOLPN|nr:uncharacterized protein LOC107027425 [Solanum pennellii]
MEVKDGEVTRVIPKTRKQYNDSDRLLVQKNHKARKLMICGLSINEYDLISSCESAKEIWNLLKTTYEGTEEIRKCKLDLFSTQFEDFTMNDGELIHEVRTRFSNITDELMFLEEHVPIVKQVSKILEILPRSWTNDFVTGNDTREPDVMTMYTLFEHLQVQEMHRKNEGLFLKGKDKKTDLVNEADPTKENNDKATSSSEVCGMSYLSGHSIGNFSVHKADHMTFVTTAEGKDKEGDQVHPKISRREVFFGAVKREMAAWENPQVIQMIQKTQIMFSWQSQTRKILMKSEMTDEKVLINNSLDMFQDGKIAIVAQISDIKSQMVVLEAENLELKEKIKGATTTIFK